MVFEAFTARSLSQAGFITAITVIQIFIFFTFHRYSPILLISLGFGPDIFSFHRYG